MRSFKIGYALREIEKLHALQASSCARTSYITRGRIFPLAGKSFQARFNSVKPGPRSLTTANSAGFDRPSLALRYLHYFKKNMAETSFFSWIFYIPTCWLPVGISLPACPARICGLFSITYQTRIGGVLSKLIDIYHGTIHVTQIVWYLLIAYIRGFQPAQIFWRKRGWKLCNYSILILFLQR